MPNEMRRFKDDCTGGGTVTALFLTSISILFVGLMIDAANGWRARAHIQIVSDTAAFAAAQHTNDVAAGRAAAVAVAQRNMPVEGYGEVLLPEDVHYGYIDTVTQNFVSDDSRPEAVQITMARSEARGNPLNTLFLGLVGQNSFDTYGQTVLGVAPTVVPDASPCDDSVLYTGTGQITFTGTIEANVCVDSDSGTAATPGTTFTGQTRVWSGFFTAGTQPPPTLAYPTNHTDYPNAITYDDGFESMVHAPSHYLDYSYISNLYYSIYMRKTTRYNTVTNEWEWEYLSDKRMPKIMRQYSAPRLVTLPAGDIPIDFLASLPKGTIILVNGHTSITLGADRDGLFDEDNPLEGIMIVALGNIHFFTTGEQHVKDLALYSTGRIHFTKGWKIGTAQSCADGFKRVIMVANYGIMFGADYEPSTVPIELRGAMLVTDRGDIIINDVGAAQFIHAEAWNDIVVGRQFGDNQRLTFERCDTTQVATFPDSSQEARLGWSREQITPYIADDDLTGVTGGGLTMLR